MAVAFGVSAPRLLQSAALLAALAGVVVWSSSLMTSAQSSAPLQTSVTQEGGSASPASQWFANQPSQVQISVSGVMQAHEARWRLSGSMMVRRAA